MKIDKDMKKVALLFLALAAVCMANAQTVDNARFEQSGKAVKIYYDLSEEADVSIYLSTDGGRTYESSPLGHVTGDVGQWVPAGKERCAVWDVLADRDRLQGDRICFKVHAARRIANETFTVGGVSFTMVYVEGGTFTMGCTLEQGGCGSDEKPTHSVTLSDYFIGETEVTQALWEAVMGTTVRQQRNKASTLWPMCGEGGNYPMYYVSWDECCEFVKRLNQMTGRTFRLPTEAEWEYAARGGNKSSVYRYSGSNNISSVAWYDGNSGSSTHPVAQKQANELGLYDMSGNVWEWCSDWYGRSYYSSSPQSNPKGLSSGSSRVLRGGSCINNARYCRVSDRNYIAPSLYYGNSGFRLVLSR